MDIVSDFSFLNELRADNEELQVSLQRAYAHAANAESECGVNQEQFISALRKSALCLAQSLCTAYRLPFDPAASLGDYTESSGIYAPVFGDQVIHKLREIDRNAVFRKQLDKASQLNLLRYLQSLAADICRMLGGKVPEKVLSRGITLEGVRVSRPKEQRFAKTGFSPEMVDDHFRQIQIDSITEEKLSDRQQKKLEETVITLNNDISSIRSDLEKLREAADTQSALDPQSIDELAKKLQSVQSSLSQELHLYQNEHDRQAKQLLEEIERLSAMMAQNKGATDDLLASIADIQSRLDNLSRINTGQEQNIRNDTDRVGESISDFIKENRGKISELSPALGSLIKKLVRTGANCVKTGKVYAEEAVKAAKEAYQEAEREWSESRAKASDQKNPEPSIKGLFRKSPRKQPYAASGTEKTASKEKKTGSDFDLSAFCNKWSILAKNRLHRRINALTAVLILTWLVILILFSGHDTSEVPLVLSRFLSVIWYLISWCIGLLATFSLLLLIFRSICGLYLQLIKKRKLEPFFRQLIRPVLFGLLLYLAGTYIHNQFYPPVSQEIGWKYLLTVRDPGEFHQIFEWLFQRWRFS